MVGNTLRYLSSCDQSVKSCCWFLSHLIQSVITLSKLKQNFFSLPIFICTKFQIKVFYNYKAREWTQITKKCINPFTLITAKTLWSCGRSECNRVKGIVPSNPKQCLFLCTSPDGALYFINLSCRHPQYF